MPWLEGNVDKAIQPYTTCSNKSAGTAERVSHWEREALSLESNPELLSMASVTKRSSANSQRDS